MKEIYLDNSATTPLSDAVKAKMLSAMEIYGNPSSLHSAGLEAEKLLREAREALAGALGVRNPREAKIVFTSCGSEASNLAILGTAKAKEQKGERKIITTDSEHPSVANPILELEERGYKVVRISTKGGELDMAALDREAEGVFLASIMMVNNETGARYDVEKAFKLIRAKSPGAVLHCDAVQGFLKTPFTVSTLGADLVTLSAHKIHGPKGVGALYVAPDIIKTKKIVPVLLGGGQEDGFRSGTENTVGIAGFGAAVKEGFSAPERSIAHMKELREYIISALPGEIRANLPAASAPHIISVTLPSIKSETMLHFLSSKGIFVSSGSACSSHSHSPSASLMAFGLDAKEADCSIRISLSRESTREDADALIAALSEGLSSLIRIRR